MGIVTKWKHAALLSDVGKSKSGTTATMHAMRAASVQCAKASSASDLVGFGILLLLMGEGAFSQQATGGRFRVGNGGETMRSLKSNDIVLL
jgi:hypothetical protein